MGSVKRIHGSSTDWRGYLKSTPRQNVRRASLRICGFDRQGSITFLERKFRVRVPARRSRASRSVIGNTSSIPSVRRSCFDSVVTTVSGRLLLLTITPIAPVRRDRFGFVAGTERQGLLLTCGPRGLTPRRWSKDDVAQRRAAGIKSSPKQCAPATLVRCLKEW